MKTSQADTVELVPEKISPEQFHQRYADTGKPALFRKLVDWPALDKWTFDFLSEHLADTLGGEGQRDNLRYFSLGNYAACLSDARELSMYADQQDPVPEKLRGDISIPPYVPENQLFRERLWLGPPDSETRLHQDGVHNLIVILRGEKRFQLLPPVHANQFSFEAYEADKKDLAYGTFPKVDLDNLPGGVRPIEVSVRAGECLFLPIGWWHQVTNPVPNLMIQYWWRAPDHLISEYLLALHESPSYQDHRSYKPSAFLRKLASELPFIGRQDDLALGERLLKVNLVHGAMLFAQRWIVDVFDEAQRQEASLASDETSLLDKLQETAGRIATVLSQPGWFSDRRLAAEFLGELKKFASQLPMTLRPTRYHVPGAREIENADLLCERGDEKDIALSEKFLAMRTAVGRNVPRGGSCRTTFKLPALLTWRFEGHRPTWELITSESTKTEEITEETIETDNMKDLPLLLGLSLYSSFDVSDVLSWYQTCAVEVTEDYIRALLHELVEQSKLSVDSSGV